MPTHVELADYTAFAGDTDGDPARAAIYLGEAERFAVQAVGRDFYDADDPEADASQDWVRLVVRTVAVWRRTEMAAVARLTALSAASDSSAVKSITKVDEGTTKTVTYRDPAVAAAVAQVDPATADPRIAEIIAYYRSTTPDAAAVPLFGFTVAKAARTRTAIEGAERDVSRRCR